MRRFVIVIALVAVAAAGSPVASADLCDGVTGCVVAPEQPVVVAVGLGPATYEVACPSGMTPATAASTAQAGTYVLDVNLNDGNVWTEGYGTNGSVTFSGVPAVEIATSTAVTITAAAYGAPHVELFSGDPVLGGAGDGPTPPQSGVASAASTGVSFTARPPDFPWDWMTPDAVVDEFLAAPWMAETLQNNPVTVTTAASFTPQVACVPQARTHTRARSVHRVIVAGVRRGVERHHVWCPAGTKRHGPIRHAVFVAGRSRLTRIERAAISSRHAVDSAGRAHIETRIGRNAPKGLQIQLHADCVSRT